MKRNKVSKLINRISRRESLPILRGMFVFPEQVKRKKDATIIDFFQISQEKTVTAATSDSVNRFMQQATDFSCDGEDGLCISAEKGSYLGG